MLEIKDSIYILSFYSREKLYRIIIFLYFCNWCIFVMVVLYAGKTHGEYLSE